eukprot:1101889-Amphidinium_carterae.1
MWQWLSPVPSEQQWRRSGVAGRRYLVCWQNCANTYRIAHGRGHRGCNVAWPSSEVEPGKSY